MADLVRQDIHGKELYISNSLLKVVGGFATSDNFRISQGKLSITTLDENPTGDANTVNVYLSGGRLYARGGTTETMLAKN